MPTKLKKSAMPSIDSFLLQSRKGFVLITTMESKNISVIVLKRKRTIIKLISKK